MNCTSDPLVSIKLSIRYDELFPVQTSKNEFPSTRTLFARIEKAVELTVGVKTTVYLTVGLKLLLTISLLEFL